MQSKMYMRTDHDVTCKRTSAICTYSLSHRVARIARSARAWIPMAVMPSASSRNTKETATATTRTSECSANHVVNVGVGCAEHSGPFISVCVVSHKIVYVLVPATAVARTMAVIAVPRL